MQHKVDFLAMKNYKVLRLCGYLVLLVTMTGSAWAADNRPVELKIIEHEAVDGDDSAQLLYGLAYLEGRDGLTPDAKKAVYWLRRSARDGNAYAQMVLGRCYADGQGVVKDQKQAVKWWHKSADNNNIQAQYLLGKAYLDGNGVPQDSKQGVDLLTKSAEKGDKDAQYLLGKIYYEGKHVAPQKDVARSWLQRASLQAHDGAINLLAIIDGMVDPLTRVYQQSADVLIEKAEQGNPQAEYELGLRYESGAWDVSKDNEKALLWITRAANAGNVVAMKTLAHIYQHGDLDLPADPVKAAAWNKKASLAEKK